MNTVSCQLSAYPDYLHTRMGLDFSERYHTDPEYRNNSWKDVLQWLHGQFGQWGCGQTNPADSYAANTLSSTHLISALFGAEVMYNARQFPETKGYPLSLIPDLRDFTRKTPRFQDRVQRLVAEVKSMIAQYGRANVGIPFYAANVDGVEDLENTHCPLTIAYRLFGDRLLTDLYTDPEGVRHVLRETVLLVQELAETFRQLTDRPRPKRVLMGACTATFLGAKHWETFILPLIAEFCGDRETFFHSCGPSNHLLDSFRKLSQRTPLIRFDCREQAGIDLPKSARALPDVTMSYMLSVPDCLTRTPEQIQQRVKQSVEEAGTSDIHLILMLPDGAEDEMVDAFFEQTTALGAELPEEAGFRFV